MPAETLESAIRIFDPKKTLKGDDLEKYYVQRDSAAIKRLKTLLFSADDAKILFSGHMGSGKSTELNNLVKNIEKSYQNIVIVHYDILEVLDTLDETVGKALFLDISALRSKLDRAQHNDLV